MKRLLVVLFSFLILIDCAEEKYHPLDASQGNNVKEISIHQQPGVDSYEKITMNTGFSPRLLLGKYENQYTARILLKFTSLPTNVGEIKTAQLYLTGQRVVGDTLAPPFEARIYEYTRFWEEEDTLTWDQGKVDPGVLLASAMINPEVSDTTVFDFDTQIIDKWIDTTTADENNGVWIDIENAEFIKDFHSNESSSSGNAPRLQIEYSPDSDPDTLLIYNAFPGDDMFIIEDFTDSVLDTSLLYVGAGIGFHSRLYFNIDSLIEKNVSINKADLYLIANPELSMSDASGLVSLQVSDSAETFSAGATVSADTARFNVTEIVRWWTFKNDSFPNYSILVKSVIEKSNLDRVAIYPSTADSIRTPRMKIVYSTPPTLD
ncbi:DNRLRE domain-containing protein [candidate division KSB1 bacterium]|nr:DNRLRE domain-containing protein [candidate division KSB1 bacterium]